MQGRSKSIRFVMAAFAVSAPLRCLVASPSDPPILPKSHREGGYRVKHEVEEGSGEEEQPKAAKVGMGRPPPAAPFCDSVVNVLFC